MWNDSNDTIMKVFDEAKAGNAEFPVYCPICMQKEAHLYMHRYDATHGGIWMWCSSCHSYAHMSGIIPDWWVNPKFIEENELCSKPEYLDSVSSLIDPWVNGILPVAGTEGGK